ncbi:hypothetical protein AHIS1636_27410 [Arthrobacter mangrovi]|uniref:Uncharacterized protein n=1 Tax=Arthrobacter mangrovi TaxID=2966350 RepID=A0ABQ5MWF7_9MICC|nr:hypothetical protein AHIS1636_27410 [Arthrobacter mangrovi]
MGALALQLFGPLLLGLMSNGTLSGSSSLLLTFGLLLVVMSAHATQSMLLTRPARLRQRAYMSIGMIVVYFLLAIVLTPHAGAVGPVVAVTIAYALCQLLPGLFVGYRVTRRRGTVSGRHSVLAPISSTEN